MGAHASTAIFMMVSAVIVYVFFKDFYIILYCVIFPISSDSCDMCSWVSLTSLLHILQFLSLNFPGMLFLVAIMLLLTLRMALHCFLPGLFMYSGLIPILMFLFLVIQCSIFLFLYPFITYLFSDVFFVLSVDMLVGAYFLHGEFCFVDVIFFS